VRAGLAAGVGVLVPADGGRVVGVAVTGAVGVEVAYVGALDVGGLDVGALDVGVLDAGGLAVGNNGAACAGATPRPSPRPTPNRANGARNDRGGVTGRA